MEAVIHSIASACGSDVHSCTGQTLPSSVGALSIAQHVTHALCLVLQHAVLAEQPQYACISPWLVYVLRDNQPVRAC
jgi:hypothetical protein